MYRQRRDQQPKVAGVLEKEVRPCVVVISPSLTMSAMSSTIWAHDRMHSEKSAISLC